MNFALIGILVLAAILLFFMLRPTGKTSTRSAAVARKSRAERAAGSSAQADEGRYRCVSIICGPGACAEVLALGNRRALAAKNYMVNRGIAADRIATASRGEEQPLDPGHTEAAWEQNRRDEFSITAGGEMLKAPAGM